MTNLGATGKLRKVELRQAFSEHFTEEGAWWLLPNQQHPSCRAARQREPQMRNCASGNLEIPGLVLRTIPE
jgi:hypothetical protein